mmetsp:Transcript_17027/g.57156  ORF Transcript_17027/g.57156 Transcript_17027/m.57156 type:complete len:206 (+) Transcript_17027:37-654(+)
MMGTRSCTWPVPSRMMMHREMVERCTPPRSATAPMSAKVPGVILSSPRATCSSLPRMPPSVQPAIMVGMKIPAGTAAPKVAAMSTTKVAHVQARVALVKFSGREMTCLMPISRPLRSREASSSYWPSAHANRAPKRLEVHVSSSLASEQMPRARGRAKRMAEVTTEMSATSRSLLPSRLGRALLSAAQARFHAAPTRPPIAPRPP